MSGQNYEDIITIIYEVNKEEEEDEEEDDSENEENENRIKLFDSDFVNNNKEKCKIIYNDKEMELKEYFDLENYDNNEHLLTIKLKGINNITNASGMFFECSSLLSLPDIHKWDTSNVTLMNHMFYWCTSLESLPGLSKWNISKVTDIREMFSGCKSLKTFPDISKWDTSNVKDMSNLFK